MDKVAFCFIVKDGDTYLENNLNKIINLGYACNFNFNIYYVENDSVDNTIKILDNFKKKYNNIYGMHLKLDGKHSMALCSKKDINCPKRVQRLAYIRNNVLEKAKTWSECDYLIMLDLDFKYFNQIKFKNMFNIIKNNSKIDAIFGMSVENILNLYYDIGAIKPIHKIVNILFGQKLIKVSSAFSGFGIYRMNSIKNIKYNENTTTIEHIDFNKQLNNVYIYSKFNPIYEVSCIKNIISIVSIIILFIFIFIINYLTKKNIMILHNN